MFGRRSEYDVSNRIDTTDPLAVEAEVRAIYLGLYPDASAQCVSRAVADCARLYRGEWPGYHACDTGYHDLQHVLEVTLAMARLMDGYERAPDRPNCALGARLFTLGVLSALFHDSGYLRRHGDTRHRHGAEYTLRHVGRGARFLHRYVTSIGMPELADAAARIIHFSGYEIPVERIKVRSASHRMLGNMLGTADILAQMADRCYLEKCRDRLYPEFVLGGLAGVPTGNSAPVFCSAEDLLCKTPTFYRSASARLNDQLGAAYHFARHHFRGPNPYLDEVIKNVRYAERVAEKGDLTLLRRVPPPRRTDAAPARRREPAPVAAPAVA